MATDQYGRIIRRGPRPEIPVYEAPVYSMSSYYTHSPSFGRRMRNAWYGFSNFIAGIGNWFARSMENISYYAAIIAGIAGVIALLIWVFGIFASEGIFFGILAIIGAVIMGYIGAIGIGIGVWVLAMALMIVRFLFWNGWTFLLGIAVVLAITLYTDRTPDNSYNETVIETIEPDTMGTYRCTASVLNIRQIPSRSGKVIGTLKRNQRVTVIRIDGDFAMISFGNKEGYVAFNYLQKE